MYNIYIYTSYNSVYVWIWGFSMFEKMILEYIGQRFCPDLDMSKKLEFFLAPDFKLTWDFNWIGT